MKRCPECGREYDNTMMFCLDDGAELLYGPARSKPPASTGGQFGDELQTAILSGRRVFWQSKDRSDKVRNFGGHE